MTSQATELGKLPKADYERDLCEAYFREHYKYLDLNTYVPEFASKLIVKDKTLPMVVRLVNHLQTLRYSCIVSPVDTICTVYSMTFDNIKTSYIYLYSEHDAATGKFTHKFITTCPTFASADGEYRHRFIPYHQFEAIMREWADELEPIENLVISALETRAIVPQVFSFYPKSYSGDTSKFMEQLRQSRLEVLGLVSNLWNTYHYVSTNTSPNHINEGYMSIVRNLKGLPAAFKESQRRLLAKGETEFIDRMKSVGQPATGPLGYRAEAGQKILPLTLGDIINYSDLRYACWREVYGGILSSELLANYYTPCVPLFLQYFFISNSNRLLFDNEPQVRKFRNTEIVKEMTGLIRTADIRRAADMAPGSARDPKFAALSEKIKNLLVNEGSAATMIDTTLGMLFEHTGRTIGDSLLLQEHGNRPDYGTMFLEDPVMFRKYIFEFIYTLHCFNYKQKLFHGDLHVNNATIYRRVPASRDMKIVYIVDDTNGKPLIYTVPYNGAFACIIDMSRCIMGDVTRISRDFGPQYARDFTVNQGDAIARMFRDSFPDLFRKHKDRLMDAVRWRFDTAFKVLCAHDGYRLTNEICVMLMKVQRDFTRLKIHPEVLKVAAAIRDDYADWYQRHLEMLSDGELATPDDVPWVHLSMITKHFDMFKCEKPSDIDEIHGELADVFSMMHPMDFNFNTYEETSPLLKLDIVIEQKSLHGIDPSDEIARIMNFKRDKSKNISQLINFYKAYSESASPPNLIQDPDV